MCTEYKYSEFAIEIQNYVLSALSIAAIIAYLIYYAIKGKKTLSSYFIIIVSSISTLSAALLYYCFVNTAEPGISLCMAIALLNQNLMLCIHSWTNALAVWVFPGIAQVGLVTGHSSRTYLCCALYVWLGPVVFVTASVILDTVKASGLHPVYSPYMYFINIGLIRLLLFTGPIYILVVIDLVLSVTVSIKVCRSGHQLTTQDKRRTTHNFITIIKLKIIFGFHWFLMFFTWIDGDIECVR